MTEQQNSQDPSYRAGNVANKGKFDIGDYAQSLFDNAEHDPNLKALDDFQRSHAIVDRIVGAIVANGTVEGSLKTYTPSEVLAQFDEASTVQDAEVAARWRQTITGTTGLRRTFNLVASDKSTGGLLGQLRERAGLGLYSKGLGSLDMLDGYVHAIESQYRQDHPGEISSVAGLQGLVADFVESGGDERSHGFLESVRNMTQSENPTLWKAANENRALIERARQCGVDLSLLEETANRLRGLRITHQHYATEVGRVGLQSSYDSLLE